MKLPDKKYEPKHNEELRSYAVGWNITITYVKDWCNKNGYEYAKENLLKNKDLAYKDMRKPFYQGVYDCIVEIEKLNAEETEARDVFDKMFSDSLKMLDNLTIKRNYYSIPSWQEIIEQLMHEEEMKKEKEK